ncbi:MAG: ABC transporter substrate-binding protein [Chloroflexi bacterium]|nr:ABC transporter substrate-binding protein [Chloroflexota bacterium]
MRKVLQAFLILALLPLAVLRADDTPTIAVLSFGSLPTNDVTEGAILDVLESYGFVSAEESGRLREGADLEGERIRIHWGSANFDLPTANLMLEQALDLDPDALVTLSATVTQLAVQATSAMEDPPKVLFTSVFNPFEAGIAQSPCIKPAHVTGTLSTTPYEDLLDLMLTHYPDIQTIGTVFNSSQASGVVGAQEIEHIANYWGLTVETAAVTGVDGLLVAAESLIDGGVQAFVMPIDLRMDAAGLPVLVNMSNEYGIPVFHPALFAVEAGAALSAGFYSFYAQGENLGRILVAYLNGDLDIALTPILEQSSEAIGVNLDAALNQGIEIAQDVLDQADVVIADGETTLSEQVSVELREADVVALEERLPGDQGFLGFLRSQGCSEERIALEQAELEKQEG